MSDERQGKPKKGKKARDRGEARKAPVEKIAATAPAAPPREEPAPPGTSAGTKASALVGLVAAMVLAVLVNVFAARHYERWDFTKGGLYTLSPATVGTLKNLGEPVRLDVLLPAGSPLTLSIRHLLEAYRSETTRLDVHFTDPDTHPAEFLAVQRKYAERVIDGRTIDDAAVVIARGERAHFVASRDLVEVEDENDTRARPRLEQALTSGIRAVISTDRPKACFTTGHGEKTIEEGASGLGPLRDRLAKNGFEIESIPPLRTEDDKERARAPFEGCRVVVVAGPSERFSTEEATRLRAFVEGGGNALVAAGPVPDDSDQRYLDLGLGPVVGLAGLELRHDFVFETDPRLRAARGFGETFMPTPRAHPITESLLRSDDAEIGAVMTVASSLAPTGAGAAATVPLLVTSDDAFGMVDFFAWAKDPREPEETASDHKGPLTVAFASELPKRPGTERGPRVVVIGSSSVVIGDNWQRDDLRGTAIFVESAIAWLAAIPVPLDIPNKPSFTAGLRLTEDTMGSIFRYVVAFIPLASVLTGAAIYLRRRSTERRGTRKKDPAS
ncbi:GldG family protein [Polyangium aurulentum]|uniref:GldG family protein n=1 Tax=Polyangium aurulentum TaxID=2567896 RepID=UPI0010ADE5CE|nr:GldG family protein [Polyangium aurulentum]UQA54931.1 GldG family protein [Polyangium aurulentum]